jgi:hypothetical protein
MRVFTKKKKSKNTAISSQLSAKEIIPKADG